MIEDAEELERVVQGQCTTIVYVFASWEAKCKAFRASSQFSALAEDVGDGCLVVTLDMDSGEAEEAAIEAGCDSPDVFIVYHDGKVTTVIPGSNAESLASVRAAAASDGAALPALGGHAAAGGGGCCGGDDDAAAPAAAKPAGGGSCGGDATAPAVAPKPPAALSHGEHDHGGGGSNSGKPTPTTKPHTHGGGGGGCYDSPHDIEAGGGKGGGSDKAALGKKTSCGAPGDKAAAHGGGGGSAGATAASATEAGHLQSTQLRVQGICCSAEVKIVKNLLEPLPGVASVGVNQVSRTVVVVHLPGLTRPEHLVDVLNGAKLGAALMQSNASKAASDEEESCGTRLCTARYLFAAGLALGWFTSVVTAGGDSAEASGGAGVTVSGLCAALTTLAGLVPLAQGSWRSLQRRVISMDTMMLVAVLGSAAGGEMLDAALVVTLFTLASMVEDGAMESVQKTLDDLLASLGEARPKVRSRGRARGCKQRREEEEGSAVLTCGLKCQPPQAKTHVFPNLFFLARVICCPPTPRPLSPSLAGSLGGGRGARGRDERAAGHERRCGRAAAGHGRRRAARRARPRRRRGCARVLLRGRGGAHRRVPARREERQGRR